MSEPYLGELRLLAFDFAPRGWSFCEGQILSINSNQSLYSLLGTSYGGDGRTSFALPDLRGRTVIGTNSSPGTKSGVEGVVLTAAQVPPHSHTLQAVATAANAVSGAGALPAEPSATIGAIYSTGAADSSLQAGSIGTTGGQPHNNMMPSTVLHWAIAVQGLFPSRN